MVAVLCFFPHSPLTALSPPTAMPRERTLKDGSLPLSPWKATTYLPCNNGFLIWDLSCIYLYFQSKITKWWVQIRPTILRLLCKVILPMPWDQSAPWLTGPHQSRHHAKIICTYVLKLHQGLHKATFLSNTHNLVFCQAFTSNFQGGKTLPPLPLVEVILKWLNGVILL